MSWQKNRGQKNGEEISWTLINGYILYLLFSKKGTTVFSEEYKRAIAQTPHISYRTSLVVWILLGLLLLLIGGLVVGFLISRR